MVQIREKTGLVQEFDPKKIIASISKLVPCKEISLQKYKRIIDIVLENIRDFEVVEVSRLREIIEKALDEVDYTLANLYKESKNI